MNLKLRKKRYQCQYHLQCQDTLYLSAQSLSSPDSLKGKNMLPDIKSKFSAAVHRVLPSLLSSFFHLVAFPCLNRAVI